MSKYVRRIIPFGSGDIPAVQHWLEDMAEKGLFFKECGLLFAKFTRGEPKKMRYRLDFCDVVACDIPDEKKELYEQSGWQVVGEFKSDFVVVCTDDPDAPEIYTEPELLVKAAEEYIGQTACGMDCFLADVCQYKLREFGRIYRSQLQQHREVSAGLRYMVLYSPAPVAACAAF